MIQALVVFQVAVLVSIAMWYGLCHNRDVLCRLRVDQKGRAILEQNSGQRELQLHVLNFIQVRVPTVDLDEWRTAFAQIPDSQDSFHVTADDVHRLSVCANPTLYKASYGIYICQSNNQDDRNSDNDRKDHNNNDNDDDDDDDDDHIVNSPVSRTVVHLQRTKSDAPQDLQRMVADMIPPRIQRPMLRKTLTFTLQIEHSLAKDWPFWTQAIQQWMTNNNLVDSPYWRQGTNVLMNQVFGGTLSDHAQQTLLPDNSLVYSVPTDIMDTHFHYDANKYEILLYVPTKGPMLAGIPTQQGNGQSRCYGKTKLVTFPPRLPHPNNDSDYYAAVNHALSSHGAFFKANIFGLPETSPSDIPPIWHIELFFQRVLRDTLQQVNTKISTLRTFLLEADSDHSVTVDLVNIWLVAVAKRDSAMVLLEDAPTNHTYRICGAILLLEEASDCLDELEQDPSFLPPLHFPMDQTSAIFAPLLFPLLFPMMVGLLKEYKRYNTHVNKMTVEVLDQ